MARIRSVNEIIANLRDFFKLAQPALDTKAGTISADLFIEGPSAALSLLYDELSGISHNQSLRLSIGSDLDKLGKNFNMIRRQATSSTGVALLTFSSLNANINVNAGATIYTSGGIGFSVINGLSLVPSSINFYRATATKFQAQLLYAGITDQYAVEITVSASAAGSSGNIGQYSLSVVNVGGISNVTNVMAFAGGTDQETDAAFRNRILATFSGSSVGTKLGYLNAALSVTGVQDVAVIEPGDPLMTRDGTVSEMINDVLTVVSEGSGGKVDVVVFGTNDVANTDTFIYVDKSNTNDATNPKNNWVLGQLASNANMSISQKRIVDVQNAQLPAQPVDAIAQVTGSVSGANFVEYSVDGYGRGSGNFKLIKDTGIYGGSPFGFDTFAWTSNQVEYQEDLIRGQSNGQDATTFTGVTQITEAQQQVNITNENSLVGYNRSIIQLLHTPVTNVTRVFNTNTGERYFVTNQNYDGTSPYNTTGRIQVSGNTLPSPSDVLQVDYTWVIDYDPYSDFDGLTDTANSRAVTDSIDWGYSSLIKNELVTFSESVGNNFFVGSTTHPIDTVISVDEFLQVDGYVQKITSGNYVNRLAVTISNLWAATTSVDSITWKNSNVELFNTAQANTNFSNSTSIVDMLTVYATTIILPSDSPAVVGDCVTAYLNSTNVYQSATIQGSNSGTQITIPASLIATSFDHASTANTVDSINLRVTYIANVSDLFSSITGSLPASRVGNGYTLSNNSGFNNLSIVNISRRETQTIQQNLSAIPGQQLYVELNLLASDNYLTPANITSIIRLSDGVELWNSDHIGTVSAGIDGNWQVFFNSNLYNTPVAAQKALIIYSSPDVRRFQPFSFSNDIIKTRLDNLTVEPVTGDFTVPLVEIASQASGLTFEIVEQNTDGYLLAISDGYLTPISPTTATLGSLTVNLGQIVDLLNKRVRIYGATTPNNNGYYDILSYNALANTITITIGLNYITHDQISIVRVLDGQEIWDYSTGIIDLANNRLLMPNTGSAAFGDKVFVTFFNYTNLRKAPARIIGNISDQTSNTGVMAISGTTLTLAQDVVFTVSATKPNHLYLSLIAAMRQVLGLNSSAAIPSNVKLSKIVKLEKVATYLTGSNIVLETLATYDVINTTIKDNLFYADTMISDPTLDTTDFILPNTANNTLPANLPVTGDQMRVTFYYTTEDDSETLSYTRMSALYTNKRFALIDKVYVGSGFSASSSTKFVATSFTKPSTSARYSIYYDYKAPKQNERIIISYKYNKLISDVTFVVESNRPIDADVLERAAKLVQLDLTMNVVVNSAYATQGQTQTVLQNLRNQLIAALTANALGTTIDQISLINIAQGIQGIDRARILLFNTAGNSGQLLSITAAEDQYFQPNTITINTETR